MNNYTTENNNAKSSALDYYKDTLKVLKARQAWEGPMPADWNKYCETAQHIDPNGDWTNVEYTPDNLEALINFYSNQIEEVEGTPVDNEDSQNMPCDDTGLCDTTCPKYYTNCHKTGSTGIVNEPSTEDVELVQECYNTFIDVNDFEPDAEYGAELVTIDVKVPQSTTSYELQKYIVLAQNIAGCRTPSDTDGEIVNTVELSNAQLTLMQIAMDFGIAHVRQMYAELGDDISTENVDYYCEELKKIAKSINDADTTDSTDIQIRN